MTVIMRNGCECPDDSLVGKRVIQRREPVTDDPRRHRRILLVVVSATLGALVGRWVTARPSTSSEPLRPPAAPAVAEQSGKRPHCISSAVYCALASLLLMLTVWLMSLERRGLGEITATVAVAVLAVAFRGPVWRWDRWTSAVLTVLAMLTGVIALMLIISRIDSSVSEVGGLLRGVALFIVFVGSLSWLVASWGMATFAEFTALLLIALMLGVVSFNGISYFTTPVSAPEPTANGSILVFAADPAAEMSLDVSYNRKDSGFPGAPLLSLELSLTGSNDHRWGIVLFSGARFRTGEGSGTGAITNSPSGYQVLSGVQDHAEYSGSVVGPLEESSASRSIVSLPGIASAPESLRELERLGVEQLAGFSPVKPKSLAIKVDGGHLDLLKTVTQAMPPLSVPSELVWRGVDRLDGVTYAILDQGEEDRARNVLFVVGILLGAAVAFLMGALQVLLKAAHRSK
ncbi:hypothetical protein [Amycolatopsis sp. VC5-11]|uniref:hypothetical protein n=1 Tax=Amycolatopsis sp. VC5-11 TaxID=3120156 RepID=UPI003007FAFC